MIHVVVRQRSGVVYEGMALAISGKNAVGPFDILPQHANFVSVLSDGVRLHLAKTIQDIPFDRGILRVHENSVEVYVGI